EESPRVRAAGCLHRNAQPDQPLHAIVAAARSQTYLRPEAEAGEQNGSLKIAVEPVHCGADIVLLAVSSVVLAPAKAYSAEVEPQDRKTEGGQRLHCVVDDLVVHGAAACRMRVAYQRCERSFDAAGIEQGFQAARRAVQVFHGAYVRTG